MTSSRRPLLLLALLLPLLVVGAALLYMLGMRYLEGSPRDFLSSLEFVSETLTSVGYGADSSWRHPLMLLLVIGLQFAGSFLLLLILPLIMLPMLERRFETRLPQRAAKLSNHVVIYRWGAAVETLLSELDRTEVPVLILEESEGEARRLLEIGRQVVFCSDPTTALDRVSLSEAKALIANGSDEENAAIILTARQVGFEGEILAIVEDPFYRQAMSLAGATEVFTPRHVLASALAARASHQISPRVSGLQQLGKHLQVEEVRIDPASPLAGRTLAETEISQQTGTTVIGQWLGGELETRPHGQMRLEPHGILVAIGRQEGLERLAALAGSTAQPSPGKHFVICGFGEVGRKVAELLDQAGETVRVVDRQNLAGVDVVGDVLDPTVLDAADIDSAQAVVLALDNDPATLFATVILRDRAAETPIVARVNAADNVDRIHRAGADFALSISQVSGQVLARCLLRLESVSIDARLRVTKLPRHRLGGHQPAEFKLRSRTGCSVVAVERGDQVLVDVGPHFTFEASDVLYVCGSDQAIQRFIEAFG